MLADDVVQINNGKHDLQVMIVTITDSMCLLCLECMLIFGFTSLYLYLYLKPIVISDIYTQVQYLMYKMCVIVVHWYCRIVLCGVNIFCCYSVFCT